jgi:hypothetical protein
MSENSGASVHHGPGCTSIQFNKKAQRKRLLNKTTSNDAPALLFAIRWFPEYNHGAVDKRSVEAQRKSRYAAADKADPRKAITGPEKINAKPACPSRTRSGYRMKSHLSAEKKDTKAKITPTKLPAQLIIIKRIADNLFSGDVPWAGTVHLIVPKR